MTNAEIAEQCRAFFALVAEAKREETHQESIAAHMRTLIEVVSTAVKHGRGDAAMAALTHLTAAVNTLEPLLQPPGASISATIEKNVMEIMVLRKQSYELQLLIATQNGLIEVAAEIEDQLHAMDEFFFAALAGLDPEH